MKGKDSSGVQITEYVLWTKAIGVSEYHDDLRHWDDLNEASHTDMDVIVIITACPTFFKFTTLAIVWPFAQGWTILRLFQTAASLLARIGPAWTVPRSQIGRLGQVTVLQAPVHS